MSDAVLLGALERLRGTGPEFNGFLANHGPMAAEALTRIGGSDVVPGWVERYATRLDDAPAVTRGISADDWHEHLGDRRCSVTGPSSCAARRVSCRGRRCCCAGGRGCCPGWPPARRTGSSVPRTRCGRCARQAPTLTRCWSTSWRRGWASGPRGTRRCPAHRRCAATGTPWPRRPGCPASIRPCPDEGAGIGGRLLSLRHLDGLSPALDEWRAPATPDDALDELIGAAVRVLAARDDTPIAFCHAVTGPAAVRLVLPLLPADLQVASVAASWQVVGAIVAAFASPRLEAGIVGRRRIAGRPAGPRDRARRRARDQADRGGTARASPLGTTRRSSSLPTGSARASTRRADSVAARRAGRRPVRWHNRRNVGGGESVERGDRRGHLARRLRADAAVGGPARAPHACRRAPA